MDNGTGSGAPNIDFGGNPRPSGQGFDIGAYEYQFSSDIGDNGFNSNPKNLFYIKTIPVPSILQLQLITDYQKEQMLN